MVTEPNPNSGKARMSALWPTVWLILMLVAVKATYVELSRFWIWATRSDYVSWLYVEWLAAATEADVLFALGMGAIAAVLLAVFRGKPMLQQRTFQVLLMLGFLSVIYAVISRQIFAYYRSPLTYQLLTIGGEPQKLWSSIEAYATAPAVCALVGLPVAYVLLSHTSTRFDATRRATGRFLTRLVLCVAVVAWLLLGRQLLGSNWFQLQDRHVVESSHAVLLQSVLLALPNARASISSAEVKRDDLRDFLPATIGPDRGTAPAGVGARRHPRNVVLIVLESVGARYLSLYGSRLATTPRMSAEQTNAVVFDRYYAPVAWTAYSLIALTLAQRPPMERYNELSFRTQNRAGKSLTELLRDRGYRTAFMSAGDPDWASHGFLERVGFEDVVRGKDFKADTQISSWGTSDRLLFAEMLRWIDARGNEPFFLMVWTDQTHHPYRIAPGQTVPDVLPANDGGNENLRRYLGLIADVDAQIGHFLDGLRNRGLSDDTLVIVTGDHGEAFADPHSGSGHGFTVYEEEVRVPLLLWNPQAFAGGRRSSVIGSHVDLAPTILGVLGIPADQPWDGRSLFDADRPPRTYLFAAAWGQYLLGIREDQLKYIYDATQGSEELYDLALDPDEQHNIASRERARSQRFRERLAAWLQAERNAQERRASAEVR